jgi:hypothetical protein
MNLSEASAIYLGDKPVTAIFRGAESAWSSEPELVPTGNIIVSGAGSVEANGVYTPDGELEGKPQYKKGDFFIFASGADWFIELRGSGFLLYNGLDDVATPDLVTTWEAFDGLAPAPTVTAEMGPA